jgi:hypothetical protein
MSAPDTVDVNKLAFAAQKFITLPSGVLQALSSALCALSPTPSALNSFVFLAPQTPHPTPFFASRLIPDALFCHLNEHINSLRLDFV